METHDTPGVHARGRARQWLLKPSFDRAVKVIELGTYEAESWRHGRASGAGRVSGHRFAPGPAVVMLLAMNDHEPLPRSPELMSPADTGLLVVDVQEKLIKLLPDYPRIVWNIRRLLDGAKILGISVAATEQYPQGLGPTVAELAAKLDAIPSKVSFSCGGCPEIFAAWREAGIHRVLLAGIEAHVCVQQTAIDLLAAGFSVYLAVDAIGSRHPLDYQTALRRLESAGATLTTTESVLFEWCGTAGRPEFKAISELVKEEGPKGD